MADRRVELLAATCLLVGAALVPTAHRHVLAWSPRVSGDEAAAYLPSGRLLDAVSLGYQAILADLLWVRATTLFGARYGETDQSWYPWLFHMLDLATDLDPEFRNVYKYGGTMLRVDGVFVDQSNLIFQKGMRALPQEWSLPFGIAMNYFMHRGDRAAAARYMEIAARSGTGPFYLRNLAASLRAESDGLEPALFFLRQERQDVADDRIQQALDVKIAELEYLIAVRDSTEVVHEYRRRTGYLPDRPADVAAQGLALPVDPLGGTWVWSPESGDDPATVASSRFCEHFVPIARGAGLGRLSTTGCTP